MSLTRWATLYRCMQGVPSRQLGRRAWLMAKRKVVSSVRLSVLQPRRTETPAISGTPPRRVTPLRSTLVQHEEGRYWLSHLNCRFDLTPPVDWMLTSHPRATDLQRLAMHYHEFLEAVPPEQGRDLILDWIESNPPWQSRYWMTNWNCYGLSIRCVCWMQWMAAHPELCTESDKERILSSLAEQIRFLCHNLETDICGNHLIRNIRCLFWAGRFFEGSEARRWSELAGRLLKRELSVQLLPDGMHFELSPAYHCQVLCDLLEIASLMNQPEREQLLDRLEPSMQAVRCLTHPDGLISLFSDGGLHMAYTPRECTDVWESLGRETPPDAEVIELADAGYYGVRTERTWLLVDCGKICADALPAHGHADLLSFEWDVKGQRVVVDPGVYEYEPGMLRASSRSVASHNTMQVDELEPAELIGSFRTGRRSEATCDVVEMQGHQWILKGRHRGFQAAGRSFTCTRKFVASDECLEITDEVDGVQGFPCQSRLLLHPSCAVDSVSDRSVRITTAETTIQLQADVPVRIVEAQWSPDFGVVESTHRIELDYGTTPCRASLEMRILE